MTRSTLHRVMVDILAQGQSLGAFPSAGAWVAQGGQTRAVAFCGEATPETLWDVASLTKPMVTVEVAMEAVSRRLMSPDEPILRHLDSRVTLRDLLAHRGGFPAWDDLFQGVSQALSDWRPGGASTLEWVVSHCQRLHDRSAETRYSDLGYITLAWTLQERFGCRLEALVPRWSWSSTLDAHTRRRRCLPTGWCDARQRTVQGEVNDTNCWVLGGIAGHAGVFATLDEVASWAMELLNTDRGRTASRDRGVLHMFWDPANRVGDETWVMGWDTPSPGQSTAGSRVSASTVGHLGFTGTSLWIDREADALVVLLSNRVENGPGSKPLMRAFRPRFHDAIFDALGRA